MNDLTLESFLQLATGRRGHFLLESGLHGELWLDLDGLFSNPQRIAPWVNAIAALLRPHRVDAVCGPLLGGAFLGQFVAQSLGVEFLYTERVHPPNTEGLYQVEYHLPAALSIRARGRRVAIVDDVMSAGSALRGTHAALQDAGAITVAAAALLILGDLGSRFFIDRGIAVECVLRKDFALWNPSACPHCETGEVLERMTDGRDDASG